MARRSSLSKRTRATMMGLYLLGLATIVMGLGGYMITVLSGHLVISYGSGTTTTLTNITDLYLGTTGYVENFSITPNSLPYTLIIGNGSTTHNLTVVNESSTTKYTIDSVQDVNIPNAKTLSIRYNAYDQAMVSPIWYFNITTTQHIYSFIINASTGSPSDYIALYVDNVLVQSRDTYIPLDNEYIVFSDNNIQYIVNDGSGNNTIISYNDNYGDITRIQTNVDNYFGIYYVETTAINYYLDNNVVLSDQSLLPIKYVYDDLYIGNTVVLENYTITSIQSSEPITITVYYNSGSFDLGFIPGIIVVGAGIFLMIRALTLIAGVRL